MTPLTLVVDARLRSGRGSVLGPDTSRRARWWELDLTCGHTVERPVRYGPPSDGYARQRGGTQHRSENDVLPAPKRARCPNMHPRPIRIADLPRELAGQELVAALAMSMEELALAYSLATIHGQERGAKLYVERGGHVRFDDDGEPVLLWDPGMAKETVR